MIIDIAKREQTDISNIRRRIELVFLSPAIISKILSGEQPADLTLKTLSSTDIPMNWSEQWTRLGFG